MFGASPGLGARRVAPVPARLVALGKGWIDPRAADAEEFGEFGLGVVRRIVKLSLGGSIHDPTGPVGRLPSIARDCPARTPKGSTGGYDYQRLKFSGSHSAILALIQLFELWKSLTAFPGPTSSSRRARSWSASPISST